MGHEPKIVLFGPAHSGKSTLTGYLKYQSSPEECEREIQHIQNELLHYDAAQALAYLVDKSADERRRTSDPKLGTSKRLHVSSFKISGVQHLDFYTLDTPGSEHRSTHRYRGMMFSDAGAYCIEAKKVIEYLTSFDQLDDALSLVLNWSIFKPESPLLIVVTKMDIVGWEPSVLDKIHRFKVAAVEKLNVIDVIPVCIDIERRLSVNIIDTVAPTAGINSFFNCMKDMSDKLRRSHLAIRPANEPFLFIANRVQEEYGVGTRFVGKMMRGHVKSQRASVAICRRSTCDRELATVRKLRVSPDEHIVDELREGELGIITLNKNIDKSDSVILCDPHMPTKCGNIIRLFISDWTLPHELKYIGREIELIHLGSRYTARIVDLDFIPGDRRGAAMTIFIRSGFAWVTPSQGAGKDEVRLGVVFISIRIKSVDINVYQRIERRPVHEETALMSAMIEECGLRANIEFRDIELKNRLFERLNKGVKNVIVNDLANGEADWRGLDYLLKLWKRWADRSEWSGDKNNGPLGISIQ